MALNGATDSEIQLYGRWRSRAFLDYLRPEVAAFAAPMSRRMIQQSAAIFTNTPPPPAESIILQQPPNFDSLPAALQGQTQAAQNDPGGLFLQL
jgi:hypothetical protein